MATSSSSASSSSSQLVCVCSGGCTLCDSGSLRARLLLTGTRVSDLRRAVTPATTAASPSDTSLLVGDVDTRVTVCVCVLAVLMVGLMDWLAAYSAQDKQGNFPWWADRPSCWTPNWGPVGAWTRCRRGEGKKDKNEITSQAGQGNKKKRKKETKQHTVQMCRVRRAYMSVWVCVSVCGSRVQAV